MIEFEQVEFENFLSFEQGSLALAGQGLVHLRGENLDAANTTENDAGKSNVIDAITWVLFERLAKTGKKQLGDSVVNRDVGKNCHVRLLWTQDGERYELNRYRKHEHHGDKVFLTGGKIAAAGRRDATNEEIVRCLGMTYEMYLRSVLWNQGTDVRRLTRLTDGEYKLLFDELIATEHYNEKLAVIKQKQLAAGNEARSAELALQEIQTKITVKKEELAKCGTKISPKTLEEIRALWTSFESADKAFDERSSAYRAANTTVLQAFEKENDFTRRTAEAKQMLFSLNEGAKQDKCSQCGQTLRTEGAKLNIVKVREVREQNLKTAEQQLRNWKTEHKQRVTACDEASVLLDAAKQYQETISGQLITALRGIGMSCNTLFNLNDYRSDFEVLVSNQGRAGGLVKELNELSLEAHKARKRLEEAQVQQRRYEKLARPYGPGGMRIFRLEELTPHLNARAEQYTEALSGGALDVRFTTTEQLKTGEIRERYGITVNPRSGVDFSLSGGGMTRRADLIAAFALDDLRAAMTAKQVNLKIYDEATDGLDSAGEMCFVDVLRAECKGTTLFTSHRSSVADNLFDGVVTVRKEAGVSRIV